jgi:hypothetical protein
MKGKTNDERIGQQGTLSGLYKYFKSREGEGGKFMSHLSKILDKKKEGKKRKKKGE